MYVLDTLYIIYIHIMYVLDKLQAGQNHTAKAQTSLVQQGNWVRDSRAADPFLG